MSHGESSNIGVATMLRPTSSAVPSIVGWLGYGGLVPFVGLAAGTVVGGDYAAFATRGLQSYGAVILSFVGAIHWGFAMTLDTLSDRRRTELWIWSVIPALVAWIALFLVADAASVAMMLCFAVQYWQDRRLAREVALAAWFMPLRLRLTIGACLSLAVVAVVTATRGPAV